MTKFCTVIENRTNNEVYMLADNYIVIIPVNRNNMLCPDYTRRAVLLDDTGNKIEYVFLGMKNATYGHGFPEPSRLELEDVIVNGKSSWTIGERYHGHVPCNVDKIACWLQEHYEDFLEEGLK